uniref:Putative ovule protein n=1 Tax=Solanum chacoense TaxID=4108 RepID=A0A0V0H7T0_SOLCH
MMNYQECNSTSISSTSLVDVSSFLLFESTGDSEFDSSFCSTTSDDPIDSLITLNSSHRRFLEDDDAQSCSYEDMEMDFKIENNDANDDDDDDVDTYSKSSSDFNHWNSDMKDEDEDEDDGSVVEQGWMNNGVNRCNNLKLKSNVCSVGVDSELKSQKDKDKLFLGNLFGFLILVSYDLFIFLSNPQLPSSDQTGFLFIFSISFFVTKTCIKNVYRNEKS